MKISTQILTSFKPIELRIVIENEKELQLFREMFGANHSVARAALKDAEMEDADDFEQLFQMLNSLYAVIT